jgi:hypothetical protein
MWSEDVLMAVRTVHDTIGRIVTNEGVRNRAHGTVLPAIAKRIRFVMERGVSALHFERSPCHGETWP